MSTYPLQRRDVRVVKSTLWVGQDTYPLRNVTRVTLREILPPAPPPLSSPPRKNGPWILGLLAGLFTVLFWGLPAAGLGIVQLVAGHDVVGGLFGTVVGASLMVGGGLLAWKSFRKLAEPPKAPPAQPAPPSFHRLAISTSGMDVTSLDSMDRRQLERLRTTITEAINDPEAVFNEYISLIAGDNSILQYGGEGNTAVVTS